MATQRKKGAVTKRKKSRRGSRPQKPAATFAQQASEIVQKLDGGSAEISVQLDANSTQPPSGTAEDLTFRRERFIDEYMISGNGTEAAMLAGFSARRAAVTACELLKQPVVAAEIARRKADLHKKLGISQERVLTERAAIAFSDIGLVMGEDEDGSPTFRKFSEWPATARKAVKSVRVRRVVPKKGEEEQPVQILEFEFWSKPAAVDRLELRLDSEKAANAGTDLANLTDKERLRIIAEIVSRGKAAREQVMKSKKKTA